MGKVMATHEKDFVRSFLGMQREMERFLSEAFRRAHPPAFSPHMAWTPAVDVFETATHYVVKVELAGIERDRLRVQLDGGQLVIEGCRDDACPEERVTCHQMEIPYGHFRRTIFVSRDVDAEHVSAHYESGFLTVRIPRSQAGPARSVRIEVD
jgi:HSP20 family protein